MGDGYEQHFGLHRPAFDSPGRAYPAHLSPEEVEPYLVERLRAAGWEGNPMLDLGLAPLLHAATGGERAAIDRAMTALLDEAAQAGRDVIAGDRLSAWIDRAGQDAPASGSGAEPGPGPIPEPRPDTSLAEAQLDAIEGAFAEHDRRLARLRRELADLRESAVAPATGAPQRIDVRLETIEARLDQQEAALRHVLERLIAFFEEGRA